MVRQIILMWVLAAALFGAGTPVFASLMSTSPDTTLCTSQAVDNTNKTTKGKAPSCPICIAAQLIAAGDIPLPLLAVILTAAFTLYRSKTGRSIRQQFMLDHTRTSRAPPLFV